MNPKPKTKIIESSNIGEIYRTIQDHQLTSTGVGEWTGIIDGKPVTIRLVRRSTITQQYVQKALAEAARMIDREPRRIGQHASLGETMRRLTVAASTSRWF